MPTVTATDFKERLETFEDTAQTEPVTIVRPGGESLVLISAREYGRLKALDRQGAYFVEDLPDDIKMAIERAEPPEWARQFNHEVD